MGTEKLEHKLEQDEIKQTRTPPSPIRFKDEAINKINNVIKSYLVVIFVLNYARKIVMN